MAAAILRHRIRQMGLASEVQVFSAGVWAENGSRASGYAGRVLADRAIDLADHRSQSLTPALVKEADIILVMEEAHRRSIFYMAPQHLAKVFLLTEMTGGHADVLDPFGGTYEEYVDTADELTALIDRGLPAILKRIGLRTRSNGSGNE
jgi:protein-tyrosine phosphatase